MLQCYFSVDINETKYIWMEKAPIIIMNGWCYWTPVSGSRFISHTFSLYFCIAIFL